MRRCRVSLVCDHIRDWVTNVDSLPCEKLAYKS